MLLRSRRLQRPYPRIRPSQEKRGCCRYSPIVRLGVLGWQKGGQFTEARAELIDVSMSGCLIRSASTPRLEPGESIWFRTLEYGHCEWLRGILVEVRRSLFRRGHVRMRFQPDLDYFTFKLLTLGPDDGTGDLTRPDFETDIFWR